MNDAMFERLMQMVESAGEGAAELAILYMLIGPVQFLIGCVVFVYTVRYAVCAIASASRSGQIIMAVARRYRIRDVYPAVLTASETRQMIDALNRED